MGMTALRWVILGLLVLVGVYFLAFHTDLLPANHEAIGLGKAHLVHDAVGIVLFVLAGVLWHSSRRAKTGAPTA